MNTIIFQALKTILSSVTRRNLSSATNIFSGFARLKLGHDSSDGWVQWILSEGSAEQKLDWLAGQAPLPGRWDPIIRQTRTPPPGFHSSTVYHMALSSWAPLTDNERRQPVQLQAKHSAFYRPKHVSGKLTVSIQFCSAFKRPITITFPWAPPPPPQLQCLRSWQNKNWLLGASFWIHGDWHLTEPSAAWKREKSHFSVTPFFLKLIKGEQFLLRANKTRGGVWGREKLLQ